MDWHACPTHFAWLLSLATHFFVTPLVLVQFVKEKDQQTVNLFREKDSCSFEFPFSFSLELSPLQQVGCDHRLGSKAVVDACGVCKGDNATCKFFSGQYLTQHKANGERRIPHSSVYF